METITKAVHILSTETVFLDDAKWVTPGAGDGATGKMFEGLRLTFPDKVLALKLWPCCVLLAFESSRKWEEALFLGDEALTSLDAIDDVAVDKMFEGLRRSSSKIVLTLEPWFRYLLLVVELQRLRQTYDMLQSAFLKCYPL